MPHLVYNICKPIDLKLQVIIRLCLRHFNEYRFNNNFENCIYPFFPHRVKSTSHVFLHTAIAYEYIRHIVDVDVVNEVDVNLQIASDENLVNILFCYSLENRSFLNASVRYMADSKHFSRSII